MRVRVIVFLCAGILMVCTGILATIYIDKFIKIEELEDHWGTEKDQFYVKCSGDKFYNT